MKRMLVIVGSVFCIAAGVWVSASAYPLQESPLLQRCLQYERVLTLPADCPRSQRILLSLTLAAADVPPSSPEEYREAYEQAGILVLYRITSDTSFIWDGAEWSATDRTSYSYSSGSHVSEEISQTWSGLQWDNVSRFTYTYDGSGRLSTETSQAWQTGAWANQTMSTYSYDGSGNMIELLTQDWQASTWVNFSKSTMTYSNGRIATATSQLWQTNTWVNSALTTLTYDGSGRETETLMQNWQGGVWVNSMRFTTAYGGNGLESETVTQMWSGSAWNNTYKNDYSYDGSGNKTLDIHSMWAGSIWIATDADTSKYSGDNLTELVSYQILSNSLSSTQYTYDGFGNLIEDVTQTAMVGDPWNNSTRNVYVYESYLDVTDGILAGRPTGFAVNNYPNPFNAGTVISYSLKRDCHVEVVITNILGQAVATVVDTYQTAGNQSVTWNGTDQHGQPVASGIYFYRVQAGTDSQIRKMVLLR
jgi:hypothetical protein